TLARGEWSLDDAKRFIVSSTDVFGPRIPNWVLPTQKSSPRLRSTPRVAKSLASLRWSSLSTRRSSTPPYDGWALSARNAATITGATREMPIGWRIYTDTNWSIARSGRAITLGRA